MTGLSKLFVQSICPSGDRWWWWWWSVIGRSCGGAIHKLVDSIATHFLWRPERLTTKNRKHTPDWLIGWQNRIPTGQWPLNHVIPKVTSRQKIKLKTEKKEGGGNPRKDKIQCGYNVSSIKVMMVVLMTFSSGLMVYPAIFSFLFFLLRHHRHRRFSFSSSLLFCLETKKKGQDCEKKTFIIISSYLFFLTFFSILQRNKKRNKGQVCVSHATCISVWLAKREWTKTGRLSSSFCLSYGPGFSFSFEKNMFHSSKSVR